MSEKKAPLSKPLREVLQGAISQRIAALRNGRSQRKDIDALRASIAKAEQWLQHFPFASDESVREWCITNREHVSRIVPGNCPTSLARLVMIGLAPKKEGKVIQMKPTTTTAA